MWLQILPFPQKYSNSSLCLLEQELPARGFPASLPAQFMAHFTLLLIAHVSERKVNSFAFNGVALLLVHSVRLCIDDQASHPSALCGLQGCPCPGFFTGHRTLARNSSFVLPLPLPLAPATEQRRECR